MTPDRAAELSDVGHDGSPRMFGDAAGMAAGRQSRRGGRPAGRWRSRGNRHGGQIKDFRTCLSCQDAALRRRVFAASGLRSTTSCRSSSALISVLHIKQGARRSTSRASRCWHATGKIEKIDIKMAEGDRGSRGDRGPRAPVQEHRRHLFQAARHRQHPDAALRLLRAEGPNGRRPSVYLSDDPHSRQIVPIFGEAVPVSFHRPDRASLDWEWEINNQGSRAAVQGRMGRTGSRRQDGHKSVKQKSTSLCRGSEGGRPQSTGDATDEATEQDQGQHVQNTTAAIARSIRAQTKVETSRRFATRRVHELITKAGQDDDGRDDETDKEQGRQDDAHVREGRRPRDARRSSTHWRAATSFPRWS